MSQPFYVGRGNRRLKGISIDGYLPALEDESLSLQEQIDQLREKLNELSQEIAGKKVIIKYYQPVTPVISLKKKKRDDYK
jgi:hypothetical protein